MAQPAIRRVAVHHRIHVPAGDAEEQARPAAGSEIRQPARLVPAGLADDPDLESARGEQPADQRDAKGGMVDVRVAVDQHDVELLPPAALCLLQRDGQIRLGARRAWRLRSRSLARADLDQAGHRRFITAEAM